MIEALWHWFRHKRVKRVPVEREPVVLEYLTPPRVIRDLPSPCNRMFVQDADDPDGETMWCTTCQQLVSGQGCKRYA